MIPSHPSTRPAPLSTKGNHIRSRGRTHRTVRQLGPLLIAVVLLSGCGSGDRLTADPPTAATLEHLCTSGFEAAAQVMSEEPPGRITPTTDPTTSTVECSASMAARIDDVTIPVTLTVGFTTQPAPTVDAEAYCASDGLTVAGGTTTETPEVGHQTYCLTLVPGDPATVWAQYLDRSTRVRLVWNIPHPDPLGDNPMHDRILMADHAAFLVFHNGFTDAS